MFVATVGVFRLGRWQRSGHAPGFAEIVHALCAFTVQVQEDWSLAAVLIEFTKNPLKLDRVNRVRPRA